MNHRPSLLSAERNITAAQWRLTNARSAYLPKLTPNLGYGYNKSWTEGGLIQSSVSGAASTYEVSGSALTYGFVLSWGIFDGFSREQQVTANRVSFNNARAAANDARNLTASEIKSAFFEIEQLREQKRVSQENVDAATEDLKITQEKYNLGAATILDLLNAQVSLKQAQVSLIQADFDLNLAVAKLENAMGKM
jgi:outer membrane protein